METAANVVSVHSRDGSLYYMCPGCHCYHYVRVGDGPHPRWGWNGSHVKPTLNPSVLVTAVKPLTDDQYKSVMAGELFEPEHTVCHHFMWDGVLNFLADCTHDLKGQKVPMAPIKAV